MKEKHPSRPLRGKELSELYPVPKTIDQTFKEETEREEQRTQSAPKHIALRAAVLLTSIPACAFVLYLLTIVLSSISLITALFFCAFSVVVLLVIIKLITDHLSDSWYRKGYYTQGLYMTCIFLAAPVYFILFMMQSSISNILVWMCLAAIVHLVLVYVLAKLFLSLQQRNQ